METKILFVCTGNTCRSSMAEYIFNHLANNEKYEVESAGISAIEGATVSAQAEQVMGEKGIDISDHEAQKINEELIEEVDLILTMTHQHKNSILNMVPESRRKIFTLKEFVENTEKLEETTEELQKLYSQINQTRENFLEENGVKIERLRKRHKELMQEIGEVEDELNRLEEKLSKKVNKDKRELKRLQSEVQDLDISDPFGQPVSIYRQCAKEIQDYIELAIKKLEDF
ncbi:low molecular weight protein arginine phosphatase [Selenihalanaerobacter shriftii]|uniref:Protein-tyrosine phosphatase n=1 Tax=Selenihalanaerobacter shriftii TaxID=142842 RepID=A0A1T4L189_9FIRM|nr:low molecular weight protein arginine phosphatase [Selenihalanaerobacter shriftii]SJZ48300.1 protein-tyrosine phosphatase [Selenihalanaerobacter shriftii]